MAASKRKPSAATELKNLKAEYAALQQLQERTTKEAASEKASKDTAYANINRIEAELEQCHTLLDALPGAISRTQENGYSKNALMTRLAAWFATRGQREVF